MMNRWMKTRAALHGIALALTLASRALAQEAPPDDGADCMPSREPHECSDRCPSYDTCFVSDEARLYYEVGEQRFDCDGLDCSAASQTLGDYCCGRGEFAPAKDDDGGCGVARGRPSSGASGALAFAALAALAAWPRRRALARGGRAP